MQTSLGKKKSVGVEVLHCEITYTNWIWVYTYIIKILFTENFLTREVPYLEEKEGGESFTKLLLLIVSPGHCGHTALSYILILCVLCICISSWWKMIIFWMILLSIKIVRCLFDRIFSKRRGETFSNHNFRIKDNVYYHSIEHILAFI